MSHQKYNNNNNQQQRSSRFQPPELHSITKGIVRRIEPYGCFVKLQDSPISGLVHISQLYSTKVENVTDVVSLDDEVYVKVMDVQVESVEDAESGRTRQRHKVKLSMKYCQQDTGQDLDPDNENLENDMQRTRGGGGTGNINQGNANDGTGGANSQLGRALASNIGMSIAVDPGNLLLKGKRGAAESSYNGYALVGEDEGELTPPPSVENNNNMMKEEAATKGQPAMVRPMGRGRGTTLPAWMTRVDPPEQDKLGSMNGLPNDNGKESTDNDRSSRGTDKYRTKKRDKRHRKERHRSSSKKHRKKHHSRDKKKHKDNRHRSRQRSSRSRSHSFSSYSSSIAASSRSQYSRSRSRSIERSDGHRRHGKKKSHRKHRKGNRREYTRSRSRSNRSSRSDDEVNPRQVQTTDFTNVEEARAIMERLERRR